MDLPDIWRSQLCCGRENHSGWWCAREKYCLGCVGYVCSFEQCPFIVKDYTHDSNIHRSRHARKRFPFRRRLAWCHIRHSHHGRDDEREGLGTDCSFPSKGNYRSTFINHLSAPCFLALHFSHGILRCQLCTSSFCPALIHLLRLCVSA